MFGNVDESGKYNRTNVTVVLSGYIRSKAEGCHAIDNILRERGVLPI